VIQFVGTVGMFLAMEIYTIQVVRGWWTGRR
jgi:hypothetical protein